MRHVVTLSVIALLLILALFPAIFPSTHIVVGTKLTYNIKTFKDGSVSEETVTFEIVSITKVGEKTNISWVDDKNNKGSWIAEEFGNPITKPGEKWETTNLGFYSKVSIYESKIFTNLPPVSSERKYDFTMNFFYFVFFDGLPRGGKNYTFEGSVIVKGATRGVYYRLVHSVAYFDNGVAYRIYYEESMDENGNFKIDSNEGYYELWQLVSWNLPIYSAMSPVITYGIYLALFIVVVIELRFILEDYRYILEVKEE